MNRSLILRLGWVGFGLLVILCWPSSTSEAEIGTPLPWSVLGGGVLGILVAKFILPRVGDAVGAFIYSSGEIVRDRSHRQRPPRSWPKVTTPVPSPSMKKYSSAIPGTLLAILVDREAPCGKLNDPQRAMAFLETQISSRSWSEDDGAFLLFRLADVHEEALHDFDGALEVLDGVISRFPNTRHSANAHHRLHGIHQARSQALSHQRPSSKADA